VVCVYKVVGESGVSGAEEGAEGVITGGTIVTSMAIQLKGGKGKRGGGKGRRPTSMGASSILENGRDGMMRFEVYIVRGEGKC
jgi:hypothetical protein